MKFDLNPPKSKRTEKWIQEQVTLIAKESIRMSASRKRDRICYMYYNGLNKKEDFQYLTQMGDYTYPAELRFFRMVSPKVDLQLSKLTRRPLAYRVIASDVNSQKEKYDRKLQDYFDLFDKRIRDRLLMLQYQQKQIQEKLQELNQALSQEPQTEEELEAMRQLRALKPQLEVALLSLQDNNERELLLTREEEEAIEYHHTYDVQDYLELGADRWIRKGVDFRNIFYKSIMAARNQFITGKPIYFVNPAPGEKYPHFDVLNPIYTNWSSGSNEMIQDGIWCSYTVEMEPNEIRSKFGPWIDPDVDKRLDSLARFSGQVRSFMTNYNHAAIDGQPFDKSLSGTSSIIDKTIPVTYVFYKSPVKIMSKKTPNPYSETPFSHIVEEDEIYVNGKLNLKDGETLETYYTDDIYEGIYLGAVDGDPIRCRLKPDQMRDPDTNEPKLPIVGFSFNDSTIEPFSYMWTTKDPQDLYNILRYQEELLIVLSGVKGIVMDKAQRPDDMTPQEWMYERKQGITWIDSMKRVNGRYPTFNQFQTYDDSLSQSITYIEDVLTRLEEIMGIQIGVPRQAIGETVPTDQVGTNRMSIEQSALINEISFFTHYYVLGRALEQFVNSAKETGVKEEILSIFSADLGNSNHAIPKNLFDGRAWRLLVTNNVRDEQEINMLKQFAMNSHGAGVIALPELVKIFRSDTMAEIENLLEFSTKLAMKRAQNAQMQAEEFQKAHEKELKEMEIQYKALADQMNAQLKQAELALKEKEITYNAANAQAKNEIDKQRLQGEFARDQQKMAIDAAQAGSKITNETFKNNLDKLVSQVDALLKKRELDIKERGLEIDKIKASRSNSN